MKIPAIKTRKKIEEEKTVNPNSLHKKEQKKRCKGGCRDEEKCENIYVGSSQHHHSIPHTLTHKRRRRMNERSIKLLSQQQQERELRFLFIGKNSGTAGEIFLDSAQLFLLG